MMRRIVVLLCAKPRATRSRSAYNATADAAGGYASDLVDGAASVVGMITGDLAEQANDEMNGLPDFAARSAQKLHKDGNYESARRAGLSAVEGNEMLGEAYQKVANHSIEFVEELTTEVAMADVGLGIIKIADRASNMLRPRTKRRTRRK